MCDISRVHCERSPLLQSRTPTPAGKEGMVEDSNSGPEVVTQPPTSPPTDKYFLIKGMFLSIISGVLYTGNNLVIRNMDVVPVDSVLVRGWLQLAVLIPYSLYNNQKIIPTTVRDLLFFGLQGLLGVFSFLGAMMSVTFMPVADAMVIIFTAPLFTMVVAAIFLGERLTLYKVGAGLGILAGVTLVSRPPFIFTSDTAQHDARYWTGVGFATGCTACGVTNNIVIPLCKDTKTSVLVVWVGATATIVTTILAQFDPHAQITTGRIYEISVEMWLILIALAASGLVAYFSMTRALQMISPTIVASLRSVDILLAFVVESAIAMAAPSTLSCIGGLLVVVGVVTISVEKQLPTCTPAVNTSQ